MKTLIKNVTIVSCNENWKIHDKMDILIADDRIEKIGRFINPNSYKVIDGDGMICLPGFVDAHRHNFQALIRQTGVDWNHAQYFEGVKKIMGKCFSPELTYISSYAGALECLNAGITTVYDWFHNNNSPEHADAEIQGLKDAGIRAVFGFSSDWEGEIPVSAKPMDYADMKRLAKNFFQTKDQLLTLSLASRGPQFVVMDNVIEEIKLAKDLDVFVSMHVGDGAWGKSFPVKRLHDLGLIDEQFLFVHCNTLHNEEWDIISNAGAHYVFCPEVELNMGHGFPVAHEMMRRGVNPALGIDVVTSVPGDMFGAMRAALVGVRSKMNDRALREGKEVDPLPILASDVLKFATINGAKACQLDQICGNIEEGKKADLILINTNSLNLLPYNNPISAVVEAAHVGNIDTVFVDGKIVKRQFKMKNCDMRSVKKMVDDARNHLFSIAGVPTDGSWKPGTLYSSVSS
jgi:cytosine/adenosine deaminase-related metal-dependent hydrolase